MFSVFNVFLKPNLSLYINYLHIGTYPYMKQYTVYTNKDMLMPGGKSMSLPTIPNITPQVTLNRCESINLLLSSVALEEIGLSHILNAEGEKLQHILKEHVCQLDDYLKVNDSINQTLRTVVNSQILLQFKLQDVISLTKNSFCEDQSCKKNNCPYCKEKCHSCKKRPCNCMKTYDK